MNNIKNQYDSDVVFGINEPVHFKNNFFTNCSIDSIFESCEEHKPIEIAGRIVRKRIFGKLIFADLYTEGIDIQLVFSQETSKNSWKYFSEKVSVGDIVGICGKTGKTKNGTDSLWVLKISILTKALLPLPDKYHGVRNSEKCRHSSYLNVIANRDKYNVFARRSEIIQKFRNTLIEKRYLEMDTPILSVTECASNARQFTAHHNALNCPIYLRVSAELQLKQLILCGYDKIFEFCKNFRNEGTDKYHRQEFLNLEIYSAYSTIEKMKELVIELLKTCCVDGSTFIYQQKNYCVDNIPTYNIQQMIFEWLGIDILEHKTVNSLKKVMKEKELINAVSEQELTNINTCVNRLVDMCIKKDGFFFLKGYPADLYPLSKSDNSARFADMEYLHFNGLCVAQFCQEETDPVRLNELLVRQAEDSDKNVSADNKFITAASYGLPPMCGVGMSMERLIMLFCGSDSLYDSNFFNLSKI